MTAKVKFSEAPFRGKWEDTPEGEGGKSAVAKTRKKKEEVFGIASHWGPSFLFRCW